MQCETCIKTKTTYASYPKSAENRVIKGLQLIESDVCGPIQTPTIGWKTYFLGFIDGYSRFSMIFRNVENSYVLSKLKEFIAIIYNKFGKKTRKR